MDNRTYNRTSTAGFRLVLLLIFAAGVALAASGFAAYFRCRPIPEDSLTPIQGTLQSADRTQEGARRTYSVRLQEYPSLFVPDGGALSDEEWNEFAGSAPEGGRVSLSIRKADADKLQSAGSVAAYDLYVDDRRYFSPQSRNAALRKSAAASLAIGCAASALLVLLLAVLFRLRKLAKRLS